MMLFVFCSSSVPTADVDTLINSFGQLGTQATGATKGLTELKENWNELPLESQVKLRKVLHSAASNIESFTNTGDDEMAAILGALDMLSKMAPVAGPHGAFLSSFSNFASGLFSLFGEGAPIKKSIGKIVEEKIEKALEKSHQNDLINRAQATIQLFYVSKAYLDSFASDGRELEDHEVRSIETHVPMATGVPFMGILAAEIDRLLEANRKNANDAKQILKYIELYTTMAVLKDITLQEMAFLMPASHKRIRDGMISVQEMFREYEKSLLKFLHEGNAGKMALVYYDPDLNPVTDSYLTKVLKVPDYDRSMAGIRCLTPRGSNYPVEAREHPEDFVTENHPYIAATGSGCHWKLVPHGNNLYTVVNKEDCSTSARYCGKYLSFDTYRGGFLWLKAKSKLTLKPDAVLWEIDGPSNAK